MTAIVNDTGKHEEDRPALIMLFAVGGWSFSVWSERRHTGGFGSGRDAARSDRTRPPYGESGATFRFEHRLDVLETTRTIEQNTMSRRP